MSAFKESENFSPQKNELIRSLNSINEIIGSAGVFKTNYKNVINGFIPSINEQMKAYVIASKKAICCDIIDTVLDNTDFEKYKEWFSEKWKEKKPLQEQHKWNTLGISNVTDADMIPYDEEDVVNMISVFPEDEQNLSRKDIKNFLKYQKLAVSYEQDFLNEFDHFENSMQKYREMIVMNMLNNIDVIADVHYEEALKLTKHKDAKAPETVNIAGYTVPFIKKQNEFIKSAVKTIINHDFSEN